MHITFPHFHLYKGPDAWRHALASVAPWFGTLPVTLAWLIAIHAPSPKPPPSPVPKLTTVELSSAELLDGLFQAHAYEWPPVADIPTLELDALPRDLRTLDNERRKSLFFRMLLPIVLAENAAIRSQRAYLLERFERGTLEPGSKHWQRIAEIARRYRVQGDLNDPAVRELLLRRVDEVPVGLVLAQAANESAWGTSRFAHEGNNLFGIWTWEEESGIVPQRRKSGARHLVRAYPDLRSSIRSYMHIINVGRAYRELRTLRAAMRQAGVSLDAMHLATGLTRYSERGEEYVREIRALIAANDLHKLDGITLAQEPDG